jgi:predicted kinase
MLCHLLIGSPASGKSTLAAHLQQLIPHSQLVSTDTIRAQLYGNAAHQGYWPDIETQVYRQIHQTLDQQQPVIYDATNIKRAWRLAFLQQIQRPGIDWIGWWLTTPIAQCHQWNQQRQRQVPPAIIDTLQVQPKSFAPCPAEGFAAVYTIDPSQQPDLTATITTHLQQLDRSRINRRNRSHSFTYHPYSRLLDFERLLYLIGLLIHYPGLGRLHQTNPNQLRQLGVPPHSITDSLSELSAVLQQQHGRVYADATAIAQNLTWLEAQGFCNPQPTITPLQLPAADPITISPHAYSDRQPCHRLLTTLRFIAQHPFALQPGQGSLDSLAQTLKHTGLLDGQQQANLRKDIENILKPYGLFPEFPMKRGYFIGTGILSAQDLLQVYQILHSQAQNLEDPLAIQTCNTLRERLQQSQILTQDPYPVKAISNRPIFNEEWLPSSALAKQTDQLTQAIEQGHLLELTRFQGVGQFNQTPPEFFLAWPLQIVFHNIAWYLGYEIATGAQAGLLQFERLDRLLLGRSQTQTRSRPQQLKALKNLHRLSRDSGGLHLGQDAPAQRQYLDSAAKRKLATLTVELWFTDSIFKFVSEGTQRFPPTQMKMSPRPSGQSAATAQLYSLAPSPDPQYPHRFQVTLPHWSLQDVDLRRWILGFADQVKVVSPPELVETLRTWGQAIAQMYPPIQS